VALAAVDVSLKTVKPPLLLIVALPALDVSLNSVKPPPLEVNAGPLFVNTVMLPAVALFLNAITPELGAPTDPMAVTKFWIAPELLVIPAPLIVSVALAVIVKGVRRASGLNTMPFTSVLAEIETYGTRDESKVAVSEGPLGTIIGDQLRGLFQSALTGELNQMPVPENAEPLVKNMRMVAANEIVGPRRGDREACSSSNDLVA
jgi:hypothetical protein